MMQVRISGGMGVNIDGGEGGMEEWGGCRVVV